MSVLSPVYGVVPKLSKYKFVTGDHTYESYCVVSDVTCISTKGLPPQVIDGEASETVTGVEEPMKAETGCLVPSQPFKVTPT